MLGICEVLEYAKHCQMRVGKLYECQIFSVAKNGQNLNTLVSGCFRGFLEKNT